MFCRIQAVSIAEIRVVFNAITWMENENVTSSAV